MGCFVPDLQRDDWPRENPKGNLLLGSRIRDEIRQRVETLLQREGWRRTAGELRA